jgi:hypothetical protein
MMNIVKVVAPEGAEFSVGGEVYKPAADGTCEVPVEHLEVLAAFGILPAEAVEEAKKPSRRKKADESEEPVTE